MPYLGNFEGPQLFAGLFLVWNVLVFLRYGWDKLAAVHGYWRVSEAELLLLAFLGGPIGAKFAQGVFRHKATKQPFGRELNFIVGLHAVLRAAIFLFPQQSERVGSFMVTVTKAVSAPKTYVRDHDAPVVKVNRGL
ncbi:DUF1294 domain-containing protein [Yoonia sp. MH D7]